MFSFATKSIGGDFRVKREYLGSYYSSTTQSSHTFSSCDLGVVTSRRLIVVSAHGADPTLTRTITGITINGVSCDLLTASASGVAQVAIFSLADVTNNTADVVLTFSGSTSRAKINIYALYNLNSNTAENVGNAVTTSSSTLSRTTPVSESGIVLACATSNGTSNHIWTNPSEDDDAIATSTFRFSTASNDTLPANNSYSASVSVSGAASIRLASASWR